MSRPEGVRIVHADGTAVMCEPVFSRVDDDGCEIWSVMSSFDPRNGDRVEIADLPPHCGLEFPLANWPAGNAGASS